jgi:Carboxypeptidase regulatory-like domain
MKKSKWSGLLIILIGTTLFAVDSERTLLTGSVKDPSGRTVANAHIVLRPKLVQGSQAEVILSSSTEGEFSTTLAPGVYDLFISSQCLAPLAQEISVGRSTKLALEPSLKPSSIVICDEFPGDETPAPIVPSHVPDKIKPK